MKNVKPHDTSWDIAEALRADELAILTPQESLRQFRDLVREFTPLLQQTEQFFRSEREVYLCQLQEKLRRLSPDPKYLQ